MIIDATFKDDNENIVIITFDDNSEGEVSLKDRTKRDFALALGAYIKNGGKINKKKG